MSMTRAAAETYLEGRLGNWRTLAGLASGEWDQAVDDALINLGADTTTDPYTGSDLTYRTMLRFTGLGLIYDRVSMTVDISLDGPQTQKSRSQAVRQIEKAYDDAKKDAAPFMVATTLSGYATAISHQHDVYAIETPYP